MQLARCIVDFRTGEQQWPSSIKQRETISLRGYEHVAELHLAKYRTRIVGNTEKRTSFEEQTKHLSFPFASLSGNHRLLQILRIDKMLASMTSARRIP